MFSQLDPAVTEAYGKKMSYTQVKMCGSVIERGMGGWLLLWSVVISFDGQNNIFGLQWSQVADVYGWDNGRENSIWKRILYGDDAINDVVPYWDQMRNLEIVSKTCSDYLTICVDWDVFYMSKIQGLNQVSYIIHWFHAIF